MATQPNIDIIEFAASDVNLQYSGKPNKSEPSHSLKTVGFDRDQAATAENLNYLFDTISKWQTYFKEKVSEFDTEISENQIAINTLKQTVQDLENQIEKERVSVGEIIEITGDSTNPATLKGYGTWESFGSGQVLIGVGSHTDDRGESKTWTDGQSEGEYKHVQTEAELAQHYHTHNTRNSDNVTEAKFSQGGEGDTDTIRTGGSGVGDKPRFINDAGSSSPMNNTQPSIAVYRWKRTK
tara:strand:- start:32219 stop:32935 length:717 start_codon:yes stop_codon:yes gene_type:complete